LLGAVLKPAPLFVVVAELHDMCDTDQVSFVR